MQQQKVTEALPEGKLSRKTTFSALFPFRPGVQWRGKGMSAMAIVLSIFFAGLLLGGGIGAVVMAKLCLSRLADGEEEQAAEEAAEEE